MARTALVTGAAGFIGSHLSRELTDQGVRVVALDLRPAPPDGHFHRFVQGDIRDAALLRCLCDQYKFVAVYHLAAMSGVRHCEDHPTDAYETNVVGTALLLEAIRASHDAVDVVVASSSSVYGRQPTPWAESLSHDSALPVYATSKALCERVCGSFASSKLRVTVCRMFTVYGPGGRDNMAVQSFIGRLNSDRELRVFGDLSAARDFTFVSDAVAGLLACATKRQGGHLETVNIAAASPNTLYRLVAHLERLLCKPARLRHCAARPEDVPTTHAVVDYAATLGLPPCLVPLSDGLVQAAQHHLEVCAVPVVALIAVSPGREVLIQSRALRSVAAQTLRPDLVVVVLDYKVDDPEGHRLLETLQQRNRDEWHLTLHCLFNRRTQCSASGAWNTGLLFALTLVNPYDTMIAVLDDDDEWRPHHLGQCMEKVRCLPGADLVVSGLVRCTKSGQRPQSIPEKLESADFLVTNPHVQGSNLFIRFSVILRAGLFDEALSSCTDRDLCIRVFDLGDVRVRFCRDGPEAHSVLHYAEDDRPRLSSRGSKAKLGGLSVFWAKYFTRMTDLQRSEFCARAEALFGWNPSLVLATPVFPLLPSPEGDPAPRPVHRGPVLVGIISDSRSGRVSGLLSDLAALRPLLPDVDVVVLENGPSDPSGTLATVVAQSRANGLRCSLLSLEDQAAQASLFPDWIGDARSGRRRSIAEARTLLQLYCWALLQELPKGCLTWLLDDDKRLDERCLSGFAAVRNRVDVDAVFGIDANTPPLPAASMVRTQLVDVLSRVTGALAPPAVADDVFYHDLSAESFKHLEMPVALPSDDIDDILDAIAHGIECSRPAGPPAREIVDSDRRGGCALIVNPSMLVDVAAGSPRLEGGRHTRRSDMIWAALNRVRFGRRAVLLPAFVVTHDRQPERSAPVDAVSAIHTLVDDILGSAVYRHTAGLADFVEFAADRFLAAKASLFRVNGAMDALECCLRGRTPTGLVDLRRLYSLDPWQEALDAALASLTTHSASVDSWQRQHREPLTRAQQSDLARLGADLFRKHRCLNALPTDAQRADFLGCGSEGVVWSISSDTVCKVFDRSRISEENRVLLARLCATPGRERFTTLNLPSSLVQHELRSPLVPNAVQFPGHLRPHDAAQGLIDLVLQCRELGITCNNISPANVIVAASTTTPKLVDWGRDIVLWTAAGEEAMVRRVFLLLQWHHRSDLKKLFTRSVGSRGEVAELAGIRYLHQALAEPRSPVAALGDAWITAGIPVPRPPIVDVSALSFDGALAAISAQAPPFLCTARHPAFDAPSINLARLLRTAGLCVASRWDVRRIRVADLLPSSPLEVLLLQAAEARPSTVSLAIRTDAGDWHSLYSRTVHLITQLEGPREYADERVLLIDSREMHPHDSPDLQALRRVAAKLQSDGWIDRIAETSHDPRVLRQLYSTWLDSKASWPQRPDVRLASVLETSCDMILHIDADAMVGRRTVDHCLFGEAAWLLANSPPGVVSCALSVYEGASEASPLTGSRARVYHCARLRAALCLPHRTEDRTGLEHALGGMSSVEASSALFVVQPFAKLKRPDMVGDWGLVLGGIESCRKLHSCQEGHGELQLQKLSCAEWLATTLRPRKEQVVLVIRGQDMSDPCRTLACIEALQAQTFREWGAVVMIEGGSDELQHEHRRQWLSRLLRSDTRFSLLQPRLSAGRVSNMWMVARHLIEKPDAVIIPLRTDDMLASNSALQQLAELYRDPALELAESSSTTCAADGNISVRPLFLFRRHLWDRLRSSDLAESSDVWASMMAVFRQVTLMSRELSLPWLVTRPTSQITVVPPLHELAVPPYARRAPTVSVIGHSSLPDSQFGEQLRSLCIDVGKELARHGYVVITGGLGGVMEATARGVQIGRRDGSSGIAVGLLPGGDSSVANPFLDVTLPTSLDHARNVLVAQSDAVVVIGGGAGTLSEVCLAWAHRRLVIAMLGSGGVADSVAGSRMDKRVRYSNIPDDRVYAASSVDELARLLAELLPLYRHRKPIQACL